MVPRNNLIAKVLIIMLVVSLIFAGCAFNPPGPSSSYGSSIQSHSDTSGSTSVTGSDVSTTPSTSGKPDVVQTPGISKPVSSSETTTPMATPSGTKLPSPISSPSVTPNQTAKPTTVTPTTAESTRPTGQIDYRQEMRDFVKRISATAKSYNSKFVIIPQNGEDLVLEAKQIQKDYLNAVDGIGREDFLYGYQQDNLATPSRDRNYILAFLNIFKANNKSVLITDYCSSESKVMDSYQTNSQYGFISFAANQRDLNSIPSFSQPLFNENPNNITAISSARNFLYIINPEKYNSKSSFIEAIANTNYDLVIIDLFFNDAALTQADISSLKVKKNGAKRMLICYMSIGEAEDYRYYWKNDWIKNPPTWLLQENPDWAGNYKVNYWEQDWQQIILGQESSYLSLILKAGFDGVYMDIIDAYEYFME